MAKTIFYFCNMDFGISVKALIEQCEDPATFSSQVEHSLTSLLLRNVAADEKEFVDKLRLAPGAISRCSVKWDDSHTAYRCKTCGTTPSSCICIDCFERGNHIGHDFMIYSSTSGGCCDCGDDSSWKTEGFCSLHQGRKECDTDLSKLLPDLFLKNLEAIFSQVFLHQVAKDGFKGWKVLKLYSWMQGLCGWTDSVRAAVSMLFAEPREDLVSIVGNESLILIAQEMRKRPKKLSFLDFALAAAFIHKGDYLISISNMILELLFDSTFKWSFAVSFLDFYRKFYSEVIKNRRTSFDNHLDKLTVQLFTVKDICLELVRKHSVIQIIIDLVVTLFFDCAKLKKSTFKTSTGLISNSRRVLPAVTTRHWQTIFWQLLQDLRIILSHKECALIMIQDETLMKNYYSILKMLHQMHIHIKVHPTLSRLNVIPSNSVVNSISFPPTNDGEIDMKDLCDEVLEDQGEVLPDQQEEQADDFAKWSFPISIENELIGLHRLIFDGLDNLPGDKSVQILTVCLKTCVILVDKLSEMIGIYCILDVWKFHPFQLSLDKIGFNLPLHRTLSLLLCQINKYGFFYDLESLSPIKHSRFNEALIEFPLRVLALSFQANSGLWIENGRSVWGAASIYSNSTWSQNSFDLDFALVQIASLKMDGDALIGLCLRKFEIGAHFQLCSPDSNNETVGPRDSVLLNHFFVFTVSLINSTSAIFANSKERLRHEVIQWLCSQNFAFSELVSNLPSSLLDEKLALEEILNEIANYHQPHGLHSGAYKLKRRYWKYFDPLFIYFTTSQRQQAQSNYLDFLRIHDEVQSPSFQPIDFGKVPRYLMEHPAKKSRMLFAIAYCVVQNHSLNSSRFGNADVLLPALRILEYILFVSGPVIEIASSIKLMLDFDCTSCTVEDICTMMKVYCDSALWFAVVISTKMNYLSIFELLFMILHSSDSRSCHDIIQNLIRMIISKNQLQALETCLSRKEFLSKFLYEDTSMQAQKIALANTRRKAEIEHCRNKLLKLYQRKRDNFARKHPIELRPLKSPQEENKSWEFSDINESTDQFMESEELKEHACTICGSSIDTSQPDTQSSYGYCCFMQEISLIQNLESNVEPSSMDHALNNLIPPLPEDFSHSISSKTDLSKIWRKNQPTRITMRSCGHVLHFHCYSSYILHEIRRNPEEVFNSLDLTSGEFHCPLCRRICNCILPFHHANSPS